MTETHFTSLSQQNISGYDPFHTIRDSETASGGISLFFAKNLNAKKIECLSFSNSTIEVCTAEFKLGNQQAAVVGVYRPHSDTIDNFNLLFSNILCNKLLKNKICIIMGDLNICLLKPNDPNLNFANVLFSYHFMPLITKATRFPQIDGEQPSCLDHIWINKFFDLDAGIISIDVSDHLPTFVNLKVETKKPNEKIKIQFRVVNDLNKIKFKNLVLNFDWNNIKSNNTNLYAEKFVETVDKLYCTAFPLKTKYVPNKDYHNPWITDSVKKLIEAKSHYFQLYKLSLVTLEENKRFRNKVNSMVRQHKAKFYADLFENSKNDLRKTWITINNLLSKNIKTSEISRIVCNNITYTSSSDIASIFNDFFCSIGSVYDSNIPDSDIDPCKYINVSHQSYFFLEPVSPIEVEYHINNLKNSKQDINSVSITILKEYSEIFSHLIADLINQCFVTGVFPNSFKKAIVLPLHKKESPDIMANYRPISILPKLSKLLKNV